MNNEELPYLIECIECGWQGDRDDLVCSDEDAESEKLINEIEFNLCPDCGIADKFEEYKDE